MQKLLTRLTVLYLAFENWTAEQPYNVRWAIACAKIGIVAVIIETAFVLAGLWNWPTILITIIIFGIGSASLYSDEYWNGPGGD